MWFFNCLVKMINITLRWRQKSTQHLYGQYGKIRYMKKAAKELKYKYIKQIKEQYSWWILEGDLSVEIHLYFPDKRKRDWDNYHKLSMDAMEDIVYKDDNQIQKALVIKTWDNVHPRIEIKIQKI